VPSVPAMPLKVTSVTVLRPVPVSAMLVPPDSE
jgi:hypothetical protein